MLKLADPSDDGDEVSVPSQQRLSFEETETERLVAAVRRQLPVIVAGCIFGLVLGVGYIITAVPKFAATAVILLDNRRVRAGQDLYDSMPLGIDATASMVDSQVEVLKSDSVALTVVDKLQLTKDPEFSAPHPGWASALFAAVWELAGLPADRAAAQQPDPEVLRHNLAEALRSVVQARRVPRTLVMEIEYRRSRCGQGRQHRQRLRRSLYGRSAQRQI